jgi:hypothetical protein
MAAKSLNKNLHTAKSSKKDEFYTQLSDIEKEIKHYKAHFKVAKMRNRAIAMIQESAISFTISPITLSIWD